MAKSLSQDLRSRLISAVAGGMSRRAAAERFGVSAASAVRWVRAWHETGRRVAKRQGGDRRSDRIEVLSQRHPRCDQGEGRHHVGRNCRDAAQGSRHLVRVEHGVAFPRSARHDAQKKRRTQPSRTGPTSPRGASFGWTPSLTSMRTASSSSTRLAPRRKWRVVMVAPNAASVVAQPFRTAIGRPPHSPVHCAGPA